MGMPPSQPGRSQPSAGAPGGSRSRIGSSGAGGIASGPNPIRPASQNSPNTTTDPRASRIASSSAVTATEPSMTVAPSLPTASAPKNTTAPRTTGAPIPKRISSSVQATGWTTATKTASRVSAIMISRNVMLPKPGSPPATAGGTLMAM